MVWQVRLLAWLHIALGGLGLLVGTIMCVGLAVPADPTAGNALAYVSGFFLYIVVPLLLPALVGGIGLLRQKRWGRITVLILSGIYLLAFPLGTALGAFGLWALLSPDDRARQDQGGFAPEMTGPMRSSHASSGHTNPGQTNPDQWSRSTIISRWRGSSLSGLLTALFLAVMIVASGIDLVLAANYRLSGQPMPAAIAGAVSAAIIVLALAVLAAGIAIARRWRRAAQRRQLGPQPVPAWQQLRDTRIAELRVDPAKLKYIPLVERGEEWSDKQIAYHEDRSLLVTCRHLQPIEGGLRQTAIKMRRIGSTSVSADCRIDQVAIGRLYHLQPPAYYSEYYQGDRSATDFPTAILTCKDCRSFIRVLHPDEAKRDTPVFPDVTANA
jgi:hypothetical protein